MSTSTRDEVVDTERILRELLERLAAAKATIDVSIAAGIALNDLDGVDERAEPA